MSHRDPVQPSNPFFMGYCHRIIEFGGGYPPVHGRTLAGLEAGVVLVHDVHAGVGRDYYIPVQELFLSSSTAAVIGYNSTENHYD